MLIRFLRADLLLVLGGGVGMMAAVTSGQKELAWNPSGSGRVIAFN